jgi:hypothetical protein
MFGGGKFEREKGKAVVRVEEEEDKGNCNIGALIIPKSKREGGQDMRKPAVPRTNLGIKFSSSGNRIPGSIWQFFNQ